MRYLRVKRAGALLFAGILGMTGCSGDSGEPGAAGSSCTVTQNGNGTATITCADGTTATVASGTDGTNGADGAGCTVRDNGNGTKTITCEDGTTVTVADGVSDGSVAIAKFHGADALRSQGEFAPCPAGVTSGCGKTFVDAQITSAAADEAGVVTVSFTVKDEAGAPVTVLGEPGRAVSALVARLKPGTGGGASEWVPYIFRSQTVAAGGDWPVENVGKTEYQPNRESSGTGASNGTLTNHGDGSYTYVFKTNLATAKKGSVLVGYDRTQTHRVSIMMGGHQGPTADANFDFRPDGQAVTERRDIVQTEACLKCHGSEFHGHGGDRLTMENCVTCHVANSYDPHGGESLDMKVMIHKIHAGRELPSVHAAAPGDYVYAFWGNGNTKHSWPIAEFPAVIENCTACHTGSAPQVANWKTKPTREACGSCHDDVDFATGANHGAGGARPDDTLCHNCHVADVGQHAVSEAHDWTRDAAYKVDKRNFPEFEVELAVTNVPTRGYFVAGEAPVIELKLKDLEAAGTPYVDHTTLLEDGDGVEACTATTCATRDGKLRAAAFMVHGPRGKRMPALTTAARAQILSAAAPSFNLTGAANLQLKVDNGQDLKGYYPTAGDFVMRGTITVPVAAAAFADIAAASPAEIVAWLNGNSAFKSRAIAFVQDGKVGIRSRNLGRVYALQLLPSNVTTVVFGNDTTMKVPAGNGANNVSARTSAANDDPKAVRTAEKITYTLDPVDDVAPGTYVVSVEIADRGRGDTAVYKTPSVGWITFQVKQAAEEKLPAGNCNLCHQNAAGIGFVLDPSRHNKKFTFDAVDQCGPCHDYQRGSLATPASVPPWQTETTWAWGGGKPISKRVHAVHRGADLNYSLGTVAYDNGDPSGRDWQIHFTQDIRNCETCHPAGATSGSWMTKPARLPCSGCHDSDAATTHLRLNTWDPTPADPFSGDEEEACRTCH